MAKQKPWEDRWTIDDELDKGGQGTTYLVREASTGTPAVLKVLRNWRKPQPRRRMYQEVANLKVLHAAGCKVPAVLDDNTDEFESAQGPLYFVMEKIDGRVLSDLISTSGPMNVEQAVALVTDIGKTLDLGLNQDVLHRDLKPENLMVREIEPPDVVLLDYGLSFNRAEAPDTTRASESLDNDFLSLPERRVPGGNRRDPRSDITSLCGIFYFCLTAQRPIDLRCAEDLPPHRRAGQVLRQRVGDSAIATGLDALFDRGFATFIDHRYQSVEEFLKRLTLVSRAEPARPCEDPIELAKAVDQRILRVDRRSQLAKYSESSQVIHKVFEQAFLQLRGKLKPFDVNWKMLNDGVRLPPPPEGVEPVAVKAMRIELRHRDHAFVMAFGYSVCARGNECGIYRLRLQGTQAQQHREVVESWTPVQWFGGLMAPDTEAFLEDVRASVDEAMLAIEQWILR